MMRPLPKKTNKKRHVTNSPVVMTISELKIRKRNNDHRNWIQIKMTQSGMGEKKNSMIIFLARENSIHGTSQKLYSVKFHKFPVLFFFNSVEYFLELKFHFNFSFFVHMLFYKWIKFPNPKFQKQQN